MEDTTEEIDAKFKTEAKEEIISPIFEFGVKIENIVPTIKKEDEEYLEPIVAVFEKKLYPAKFDCDTKPIVLLKRLDDTIDEDVLSLKEKKTVDIKKGEPLLFGVEKTNEEDPEDNFEDDSPGHYGPKSDVRDPDTLNKPSTSLPLQEGRKRKVYRERKYMCKYCDKMFPKWKLSCHIRTHTGEKPYECSFCCLRFTTKSLLKIHTSSHNEKRYRCNICGKRFVQSSSLESHLLIHQGLKPYKCDICKNDFRSKLYLSNHINRVHKEIQEKKDHDKVAENGKDLVDSIVFLVCNDCGKNFTTKNCLRVHIKVKHNQVHNQKYCCNTCGYLTNDKGNLKKHVYLHEEKFCFHCEICNVSFKEKGGLTNHRKQAHSTEKPYKCVKCDSSFKTKTNLVYHIEVHHNSTEEKFPCDICNMEFKRKCYLTRHQETHTGADKKYVCEDCGLGCRSKTDIAKHVLTHLGAVERPHACEICGAEFPKRSHLLRHQNVHSDRKPYPCKLCNKAYKDPSSLKIHNETVHCKALFTCEGCGYKCRNRRTLGRHRKHCG
ncbi:zinc finger protein 25-like isoform X1 [Macrosteles quadrilineatus]|uniref:zinc finger protein 25-like isoform X1 n=1 Tax=Macrosteles quadrilineatus TaxID=74068 RepID=UPI0023E0E342|nr:zinc finger protein 25-like isoform X1 [Macrosteles quadrilineatus]